MTEPHLLAADADRSAVADRLGAAMASGRLTLTEYDDRLGRAYAARTYGELTALTTDLPATPTPSPVATSAPVPAAGTACAGRGHPRGGTPALRAAWRSWLTTALIVIGVWLTTSLATGGLMYPWPVWVIGPWGAVLLAQTLGGRPGGTRDRDRGRTRHRLRG
jgi:hypothetical protein